MPALTISTNAYVILAMLTFREMSGYELKFVMDKSTKHFYGSPAYSQIYAELRTLESHGLVTMRQVHQEQRPDKRIYRITPAGEQAVKHWLADSKVEADTYKSPFQFRLFFGHLLPPERLMALVGNQRRWLMESILILEDRQENLQSRMQGTFPEDDLFFPLLMMDLKMRTLRAELAWADDAIALLQQRGSDPPA